MAKFLWAVTFFSSIIGALAAILGSIPVALCFCIIPYCMARAASELTRIGKERIAAKKEANP